MRRAEKFDFRIVGRRTCEISMEICARYCLPLPSFSICWRKLRRSSISSMTKQGGWREG